MINKDQIINEANYFLKTKKTIRDLAKHFKRSKSAIHHDLTTKLAKLDSKKYLKVLKIIENHKALRHIIGGESTKQKYTKKKS